jgi:hypothetical protein
VPSAWNLIFDRAPGITLAAYTLYLGPFLDVLRLQDVARHHLLAVLHHEVAPGRQEVLLAGDLALLVLDLHAGWLCPTPR